MSEATYYQRNKPGILQRAKDYYKNNKEILRERAKNKYREEYQRNYHESKKTTTKKIIDIFFLIYKNEVKSLRLW